MYCSIGAGGSRRDEEKPALAWLTCSDSVLRLCRRRGYEPGLTRIWIWKRGGVEGKRNRDVRLDWATKDTEGCLPFPVRFLVLFVEQQQQQLRRRRRQPDPAALLVDAHDDDQEPSFAQPRRRCEYAERMFVDDWAENPCGDC